MTLFVGVHCHYNNNNNTLLCALYLFESVMCITLAEMIQIQSVCPRLILIKKKKKRLFFYG